MSAGYTTREVARLLKMPEHRVREFLRAGVLGATENREGRGLRFDFRDVLLLRMANRLVANGLPARRVRRALQLLRSQVRSDQPLTGVQLYAEGRRVLASDGDAVWEPESGQQHLRFDAPEEPGEDAHAAPERTSPTPRGPTPLDIGQPDNANGWFDLALRLEQSEPHKAYAAYIKALERDPEHVEAHINIGRLCSAAGELERAAAYFRQAVRIDTTHPVGHFNLAVTLHDLGELDTARDAYTAALAIDPAFADAHYNLAALLEQMGDVEGAVRHRQVYETARGAGDDPDQHGEQP